MHLADLHKLDIKDLQRIDLAEIKNTIQKKPIIWINILLIILTLFAIIYATNKYTKTKQALEARAPVLAQSLEAADELKKLQSKHAKFIKDFPEPINSDELIRKVSSLAVKNNLQIMSFSPTTTISDSFKELSRVTINIMTDDYNSLTKFTDEIEKLPFAVYIEKWSGRSYSSGSRHNRGLRQIEEGQESEPIESNIEIGTVTLKIKSKE